MDSENRPSALISSCLLGHPVRYDGQAGELDEAFISLIKRRFNIVHICPEVEGGLGIPRTPAEIQRIGGGVKEKGRARVVARNGVDVTSQFERGALQALELCMKANVQVAILKERSPSCGSARIYDGTFSKTTIPGAGVTASLLREHGIKVFSEEGIEEFMAWMDRAS